MNIFEKREYGAPIPTETECFLGADIGGTNSNFGIFQKANGQLKLILSFHFKSQRITNFTDLVKDLLKNIKNTYNVSIQHSCFACAGVVSENRDYCKPTNLDFGIDEQEIIKNTDLKCATLANDFEIIGHGIEFVASNNLIVINKGEKRKTWARAILGAGTGLGKSILTWNKQLNRYQPNPSEGGHADFCPQTQCEFELLQFIKKTEQRRSNVSWEDILSGNGISRIYKFFLSRNEQDPATQKCKKNGPHPDEIFKNRNEDNHCKKTFELYTTLYARCAKNFALEALSLGGLYIAGGIATKNSELFEEKRFMNEFINCEKQMETLKRIPIYLIKDYNVSLYGAAQFMLLEKMCINSGYL